MIRRTSVLAAAAGALAAATLFAPPAQAEVGTAGPVTVPGYRFDLLGEYQLPASRSFHGTKVAGLTGIDFDPATNRLYLLSGDRSERKPARFYTASVALGEGDRPTVKLIGKPSTLRRADGTPYPPAGSAGADLVDPQAIRFDPATGNVLWANAGARTATQRADPAIREATTAGAFVRELPKAANEVVGVDGAGPRDGGGFSGLAITGNRLLTALRLPMTQDGDQAVRLTLRDRVTGNPLVQYAYRLEAVPGNAVAEVLAVSATKFLVLERAPGTAGNDSVRLYEIDFRFGATNVLRVPSLTGATYTPVTKRLLFDISALGLANVRDLAGMTWGPTLSDGRRTLVFVSDNHFRPHEHTQFIAVGVTVS